MTEPVSRSWPALPRSDSRYQARALGQVRGETNYGIARVGGVGDVQVAKVEPVVYVARRGMEGVALLTQLEQHLAWTVPGAANRVAYIADGAAVAIGVVVADTIQDVSRL